MKLVIRKSEKCGEPPPFQHFSPDESILRSSNDPIFIKLIQKALNFFVGAYSMIWKPADINNNIKIH